MLLCLWCYVPPLYHLGADAQLELAVGRLAKDDVAPEEAMMALEAIARLAWSDDSVRQQIADMGAIPHIVRAMTRLVAADGVQCNACLTLLALVRGDGAICQVRGWGLLVGMGGLVGGWVGVGLWVFGGARRGK